MQKIRDVMGVPHVCNAYGQSEASPNVLLSDHDDEFELRRDGFMLPHPGVDVRIADAETGALIDVLRMDFGVEIYGLLTRFNPLNRKRPFALPHNGLKTLVVGMGPAGYTLSHHLMNEGFGVAAIDGLKIEPPPADITGQDGQGIRGEY